MENIRDARDPPFNLKFPHTKRYLETGRANSKETDCMMSI